MMDDVFAGRLDPGAELWAEPGVVFLDYVFEETVEVIASSLFLASIASFLRAGATASSVNGSGPGGVRRTATAGDAQTSDRSALAGDAPGELAST